VGGALAGMVDEEDGAVELTLEVAQIGEQGGDLGGGIFVEAMQAHEGIEAEERGAQGLDGGAQARLIAGVIQAEAGDGDDVDVQRGEVDAGGERMRTRSPG